MEDTLEVYHRQQDPKRPVVCLDEASKQLTKETRLPLPPRPGAVAKYDCEYERNGASNLFLLFAPLQVWRIVKVTERRTMVDFAHCLRDLVDIHFPQADTIVLVMDNLNTHKLASLYEAFPPAEARRLAAKLEIHYTPKHGSWLNMAEIELSVLHRQCLKARIPDKHTLMQKVAAWQTRRNASASTVNWRFTTADARIKLERLYPTIEDCWTTSADTKNKQLVGNFANQGCCWRQAPEQVNVHDFPGDGLGRAVPMPSMTSSITKAMSIRATPMIRQNLPPMPSHSGEPTQSVPAFSERTSSCSSVMRVAATTAAPGSGNLRCSASSLTDSASRLWSAIIRPAPPSIIRLRIVSSVRSRATGQANLCALLTSCSTTSAAQPPRLA